MGSNYLPISMELEKSSKYTYPLVQVWGMICIRYRGKDHESWNHALTVIALKRP